MRKLQFYILLFILFSACHSGKDPVIEEPVIDPTTPVTVVSPGNETLTEFIELNATSAYLLKAVIKASSNGYIQFSVGQPGMLVSSGQIVFRLVTKEEQSIGNTINSLDSSFHFRGIISIKAGTTGYLSQVDHQVGDYVQEGEQLAIINDLNSFVFVLNLPYELRPFVLNKKTVELSLPDGKVMTGIIASVMPQVDSLSQAQQVVIKTKEKNIPINLIAKVKVIKEQKENAISLPKQCVLSDETQSEFWVMKLIDSTTAVKIPVVKGMETNGKIEIVSPVLNTSDRILYSGNFGLADTAKINITGNK